MNKNMKFKLYASQHLAGFGPAIIVVGSAIPSNGNQITECHAFFSRAPDSYGFFTTSVKDADKAEIDEAEVLEAAKSHAIDFLHNYLSDKDSLKYQAMISLPEYQIRAADSRELLHLHVRGILSPAIEDHIKTTALDDEIKTYISTISHLSIITTQWKT